jgi:hypothetical protein
MKGYFEILAVLLVLFLSALSQAQYPDRDRDRAYTGQWQGRISADDQEEFNHEYDEWQEAITRMTAMT